MATSHKSSWRFFFFFFFKQQSFSRWGGVIKGHRSIKLRCLLSLWLHLALGTPFCRGTPMFIPVWGEGSVSRLTPFPQRLSPRLLSLSHLLHRYQKQAGWEGTVITAPKLTRWAVRASKCIYLPLQWPLSPPGEQWKVSQACRITAWIAALWPESAGGPQGTEERRSPPLKFPSFVYFTVCLFFPLNKKTKMYISHVCKSYFFFDFVLFHKLAEVKGEETCLKI